MPTAFEPKIMCYDPVRLPRDPLVLCYPEGIFTLSMMTYGQVNKPRIRSQICADLGSGILTRVGRDGYRVTGKKKRVWAVPAGEFDTDDYMALNKCGRVTANSRIQRAIAAGKAKRMERGCYVSCL